MIPRFRWVPVVLGLFALLPVAALAQESAQVTGQVTAAATGQPMAGVSVIVKGTTIGALTDGTGNFSIRVPAGYRTLLVSYIGYRTAEAEIGAGAMNVSMEIQPIGLEGVVVTALGVVREKRDLGYSVQDVQGDQLAAVPERNLIEALSGNVAGIQVTAAGPTGGSARIVIRGASSIAGENQPLMIVDGIPIDNSSMRNTGFGGVDYGNAAADIDPSSIESISVLKGPNAAALYGSRAANGAIVITTKSGRGSGGAGIGITASTGVVFETPLRLPEYQNVYGQGSGGEFEFVDGGGAGVNDYVDESWGPKFDGQPRAQFFGVGPWVASPDNVRNFFELGRSVYTNVGMARSGDRTNVRLSFSNENTDGMAPGNTLEKTSLMLRGGVEVNDRLSADASVNYVRNGGDNRPGTGYDGRNFMQQFVWFGRQVDTRLLKERYQNPDGTQYNWNYNYHNSPYWIALVNQNWDERDRLIGNVSVDYQFTDWLTARLRTGRDWYDDSRKRTFAVNDVEAPKGAFGENLISQSETNTDILVTATRAVTTDITLTATAGGNRRYSERLTHNVGVNELSVPGIYSLSNAGVPPVVSDFLSRKKVNSLYGTASANYKGYFNVDVTGRNDWSSTLPEGSNSFFYPSVSSALVFSEAFGLESDLLSSGKLRASWTRVGNDTDPYQLASVYGAGTPWAGTPGYGVPNTLANADLKPEETTAWEVGTDLGFFNERLGFVMTYYDSRTRNQILGVQVSAASGFTNRVINAGEVHNWGWELMLNTTPVRMDNGFQWDMTVNWSKQNNKVVDLFGDLETVVLGSYWGLNVEARKGEPFGAMFGSGYLRNAQGQIIVDADGFPRRDLVRDVLGNYNPDWIAGINNRFRYKDLDFSFLLDTKQGGNVFSVTNYFGNYSGVLETSLRGRENAYYTDENDNIVCDPGITIEGVYADGTPNTSVICPEDHFHSLYNNHESALYDASFVKLREARIGFRLPGEWARRLRLSSADVALVGRNLWLWTKVPNVDPETAFDASNVQGFEFGQFPTGRSIGFTVSVRP